MIIHSIVPIELLSEQSTAPTASIRQIDGGYIEGVETVGGGFKATRLFTTNPALYLKNEYNPGSILGK